MRTIALLLAFFLTEYCFAQWSGTNPVTTGSYVGIGTSSPSSPLHIAADGNGGELNLLVQNTLTNGARTFLTAFPGKSSIQTDKDFTIRTNYGGWSDKFILTNDGRVGIGTMTPSSPLHISSGTNRTLKLNYTAATPGSSYTWQSFETNSAEQWRIVGRENDNANLEIWNKNNDRIFTLLQNGKVGINTNTPQTRLDLGELRFDVTSSLPSEGSILEGIWGNYILGSINTTGNQILKLGVVNDGYTRAEVLIDNGNRPDGTISFKTTNTSGGAQTRMLVHGNGNVGIGTITPNQALTIFREGNSDLGIWTNQPAGEANIWFRNNALAQDAGILYRSDGRLSFNLDAGGAGVDVNEYMTISNNGRIGMGTSQPDHNLQIQSSNNPTMAIGKINQNTGGKSTLAFFAGNGTYANGFSMSYLKDAQNDRISFVDGGNIEVLSLMNGGKVGIGTANTGSFKLAVEGKIGCREVNVTLASPWPDYVFESEYKLPSLSELEQYIIANKHLPEVPSAEQVKENGLSVGEMNAILLKKVEELTMLLINQEKRIMELEKNAK